MDVHRSRSSTSSTQLLFFLLSKANQKPRNASRYSPVLKLVSGAFGFGLARIAESLCLRSCCCPRHDAAARTASYFILRSLISCLAFTVPISPSVRKQHLYHTKHTRRVLLTWLPLAFRDPWSPFLVIRFRTGQYARTPVNRFLFLQCGLRASLSAGAWLCGPISLVVHVVLSSSNVFSHRIMSAILQWSLMILVWAAAGLQLGFSS